MLLSGRRCRWDASLEVVAEQTVTLALWHSEVWSGVHTTIVRVTCHAYIYYCAQYTEQPLLYQVVYVYTPVFTTQAAAETMVQTISCARSRDPAVMKQRVLNELLSMAAQRLK